MEKSPGLAALLGVLFGAFGLMYVSVGQGLLALVILVVFGVLSGGALAPIVWIACGIWGYVAATNFNESLRQQSVQSMEPIAVPPVAASTPQQLDALPAPAPAPANEATFCTQCGRPVRAGGRFCGGCGSPVA